MNELVNIGWPDLAVGLSRVERSVYLLMQELRLLVEILPLVVEIHGCESGNQIVHSDVAWLI